MAPRIEPYAPEHLDGVLALFAAERWLTLIEDPARTGRALVAPGCTTLVAVDGPGDEVVGVVWMQSDGEIQAHVSAITVAGTHRGQGLGRQLITAALDRTGVTRVDLISVADDFYGKMTERRFQGFRITRGDVGLG
ncbi:GNAT family N-acetyltransferase [Svornostia abyssi]|uniref:GNAT family N-acetyltransferase n=1 Tax=Svornostia abyssi TaxID=2898438 RepID=A0ABY5PE61_9ACTN|nr:GNAT family N-acetyltransferase [Parviterribacteraceae bacterium J379]